VRVALISDLHGNEHALSAVLADIDRRGVDLVACLGDVATLGPRPTEVLALVHERCAVRILGNHDEFLFDPELARAYTDAPVVLDAIDWARDAIDPALIDVVRGYARDARIALSDEVSLYLFHGTPRSNQEDLLATTAPSTLDTMLEGHHATVMACGHTHVQMLRQHTGTLIVNPGSVGMPFREVADGRVPVLLPRHAEYALVEARGAAVEVSLHRVPLDLEALRASVQGSTMPLAPGLLAQYR
jgi:putative phosphoesterase